MKSFWKQIIFLALTVDLIGLIRPTGAAGQVAGEKESDELAREIFQGKPVPPAEKSALGRLLAAAEDARSGRFDSALSALDSVLADYHRQAQAVVADPEDKLNRLKTLPPAKCGVVLIGLSLRGDVRLAQGDADKAFADYDLAVKLAPSEIPGLLFSRAVCQSRRKNYEQAKADLTAVINSNTSAVQTVVALKLRGDVHFEQYHYDEAIGDYTQALDMVPGDEILIKAREKARAKRLEAYQDLQKTLGSFVSKKDAELKKAEAELAAAKTVKAKIAALAKRAAVHRDMMHLQDSEADYSALIVLDPGNPQWYKYRADLRERQPQGQQGAVDDYSVYLKLAPGTVEVYSARGRAHDRLGKHDLAVFDFDRALHLKPGDDEILFWRGLAKMSLGNAQAAIRDYDAALAAKPDKAVYYKYRAEAYEKLKQYGPAVKDAGSAIDLAPNDPELRILRGDLHRRTKEYDQALADLKIALELDPESLSALGVRADTYFYKGDHRQAVADYTAFLARSPNVVLAYYRRGRAYQDLQRYAEAIADFKKAVELDPELIDGLNSLAWILATCPKSDVRSGADAVAYARKALDLAGGEDYFLMDTLAVALAEAGQWAEAVALQERAVSLIPSDADRTER